MHSLATRALDIASNSAEPGEDAAVTIARADLYIAYLTPFHEEHDMTEDELRLKCLECAERLAIANLGEDNLETEDVVTAAEAFYAFVHEEPAP